MRPSASREEFLSTLGLPPDRPLLLYLCSSSFIAPQSGHDQPSGRSSNAVPGAMVHVLRLPAEL